MKRHNLSIAILVMASFFSSIAIGATSIVTPWIMIKSYSAFLYSFLASIVAVVSIFFLPTLGRGLKRWRAKHLLGAASLGMAILLSLTFYFTQENTRIGGLIAVVFVAQETYFLIFFASRITIVKRTVPEVMYSLLSTILEMEFQIAAFGAGALSAYLLYVYEPSFVLLLVAVLFLISAGLIACVEERMPVEKDLWEGSDAPPTNQPVERPQHHQLFIFVLAMNVPFICVMLMNVILPIHIEGRLSGFPKDLALVNLTYTVGAISSFLMVWFVLADDRSLNFKMITLFTLFSGTAVVAQYSDALEILYWCAFIWAIVNSTAKVVGQTAVLKQTCKQNVSIVVTKTQAYVQTLRVISMLGLSMITYFAGEVYLFWYMAIIALLGPVLVLVSVKCLPRFQKKESDG